MKRWLPIVLMILIGVEIASPSFGARRVVVRRGAGPRRTVVVVHRGWPIRRPLRTVIVKTEVHTTIENLTRLLVDRNGDGVLDCSNLAIVKGVLA